MIEHLPSIITAVGTLVLGYFTYNQYTKNKMTDVKIEQIKEDNAAKNKRRADNSAIVLGELWEVLHEIHADRVYIIQPHPLDNESMISVYYEAKRKGVESMKGMIHNLKMCECAAFCKDMAQNLFLYYDNIDTQVKDRYAKSILSACGTKRVAIKRLSDNTHDWVGSIFCEFTHRKEISEEEIRASLHDAAINIQYILPEYKD